jgi:hypothetical protein
MNIKVVAVAAILLASTFCLAGCTYIGFGGPPCYGFGCRGGLAAPSAKGQQSAAPRNAASTLAKNRPVSQSHSPKQGN